MEDHSPTLLEASWRQIGLRMWIRYKKLPIKLPRFYKECFQTFAEHFAATAVSVQSLNNNTRADTIIWNNKHICVDSKLIFHHALFKEGIITLEDLVSNNNDLIVKQSLNSSLFTPTEVFLLVQVIDALPVQWWNSLALCGHERDKTFVLVRRLDTSLEYYGM